MTMRLHMISTRLFYRRWQNKPRPNRTKKVKHPTHTAFIVLISCLAIGCTKGDYRGTKPIAQPTQLSRIENPWDKDIAEILFTSQQLGRRVRELAGAISNDLLAANSRNPGNKPPLVVGVLTGAVFFATDLSAEIHVPHEVKFIKASSYGSGTKSSGEVKISVPGLTAEDVKGRTVILVEDIIDTGYTLRDLLAFFSKMEPAELKICCLLSKPARRKVQVNVDYLGFKVEDKFVVGYGLDFDEKYRSLKYIGVLKPEAYKGR